MLVLTAGCSGAPGIGSEFSLGTIWDVPEVDEQVNWQQASQLALEQHGGFELALDSFEELRFTEVSAGEGNRQDDIQVSIRALVEENNIVAMLGATTNEASMRSATLANFFRVPIIIPGADGNQVIPENNFWAFRLGAPSAAYAEHLFNQIIGDPTLENRLDTTQLNVAILYEHNTFGESAAVDTATYAMAQEVEIVVYDNFHPTTPDPEAVRELIALVLGERADVVYLISNTPATASLLVEHFLEAEEEAAALPLLIGQAGGFASQDFLSSSLAEEVIVMRQRIDTDTCPDEIQSLAAAQSYAAAVLLERAVREAKRPENLKLDGSFLDFLRPNNRTNPMIKFREIVRDVLKATNQELPCLGAVAFDNAGQNKNLSFEFIKTVNGSPQNINIEDLLIEMNNAMEVN
jgi:ABC-type branched-subunit amino acid transport system substrate-binding protein